MRSELVPSPEPSVLPATISGTVTESDRARLPPDAIVILTLWNTTTGYTTPVARIEFRANGQQVPIPFELDYDANAIDPAQTYALAGEIDLAGRAIYRANSWVPVITQGNPIDDVGIPLEPIP